MKRTEYKAFAIAFMALALVFWKTPYNGFPIIALIILHFVAVGAHYFSDESPFRYQQEAFDTLRARVHIFERRMIHHGSQRKAG